MRKIIADTVVDIITESQISSRSEEEDDFKRGPLLEKEYIKSRTTFKNKKPLITKDVIENKINEGIKNLKVPSNAVVTPLARMLIEEGRINIIEE
ncbi:MAG: hypothetical protein ACQEQC_06385 [Elusimicrobiota bacterium]